MPAKNQLKYSKDLDTTYIFGPDGKTQIGYMEGDQRNNPLAYEQNVADVQNVMPPMTSSTIPNKVAQIGKDFVVNAASTAPLAFGPENIPLAGAIRTIGSLGVGAGIDKLLNPGKDMTDIAGTAVRNTGLGMLIPWLAEKMPALEDIKIPGIKTERVTTRSADPTVSTGTSRTLSTGKSAGSTDTIGSRTGSSETTSSGESEGVSTNSTKSNGTSHSKSVTVSGMQEGPHDEMMVNLENEIERLKNIDLSKFNAGQMKQVENAITKNQDALNALKEANTASISTRTTDTNTSGSSESSGSRVGTSKGKSNTNSSNTSQVRSNRTGTSETASTTQSDRQTTPGDITSKSTSTTTGQHLGERILEAIQEMHKNTAKSLTDFQKWALSQLLPDTGDAYKDLSKK